MKCKELQPFENESLRQLASDGFVRLPGLLASSSVEELLRVIGGHGGHRSSRRGSDYAARNLLSEVASVRELAAAGDLFRSAQDMLGRSAFPVRGILFDKLPQANWHVGWHQDKMIPVRERKDMPGFGPWSVKAGAVHVRPPAAVLADMLALRVHLDDCGAENGPLRVLPGSHRYGYLSSAEIREWVSSKNPVTCLARRGDILAMRPLLLHASSRAAAATHRRVLHVEYASRPLPRPLQWYVA